MTSKTEIDSLRDRVQRLGFFGLLSSWNDIAAEPWLPKLVGIEEQERKKRSLERRLRSARIGAFKSITDYDWSWPKRIDREAIDELFTLKFVEEGVNAILLGPNGVGKTMLLRNIAHQATLRGHTVRFTASSACTCPGTSTCLPRSQQRGWTAMVSRALITRTVSSEASTVTVQRVMSCGSE